MMKNKPKRADQLTRFPAVSLSELRYKNKEIMKKPASTTYREYSSNKKNTDPISDSGYIGSSDSFSRSLISDFDFFFLPFANTEAHIRLNAHCIFSVR